MLFTNAGRCRDVQPGIADADDNKTSGEFGPLSETEEEEEEEEEKEEEKEIE